MKNRIRYENEDDINIPPKGLINCSRENQVYNNYYFDDLYFSYLYNTCYINSSIQCMLRLKKFVKQVLQFHEGNLILATQNLIKK